MNGLLRLSRGLVAAASLGVAALAASSDAHAQMTPAPPAPITSGAGFDLRLFRPAVDSKGLFSVNGTDILGAGDLSFGLIVDAGFGMLRVGRDGAALVNNALSGYLSANVGIGNVLVLGAQLPIHVLSGPGADNPATQNAMGMPQTFGAYVPPAMGFNYQGLGDITLHAKFRWLRSEYYPVGLAILVQAGFNPMSGSVNFASEPFLTQTRDIMGTRTNTTSFGGFVWPSAALEWRPSRRVRLNFNLGVRLPFSTFTGMAGSTIGPQGGPNVTYGPVLTWGAGISYRPIPVLDLVAETYGGAVLTGLGGGMAAVPLELVAGIKIFVQRNSYLMLGGGSGMRTGGFASADGRVFAGFIFEPSIGDTDGDGYRDDVDQCVNDPEDFDNFQDEDGCSEPDNDRDGILDVDDQCALIPEDRDGDHDSDGCPEGQESDRDGDGILDQADRCADDPEDRDGFQDSDGCPDPDNDNDSILDTIDNCPNNPEDFDNFEDDDGCPDPDNDRDGILDQNDRSAEGQDCRNDPEVLNGVEDEDGCPDSGDLQILGNVITLREQIQFETDSAEIRPTPINLQILEQMTNLMRRNPQFELVEVEGHTDERAPDDHNLRLSNDRANAVMQALIQRGVEAARLVAAGYGEYCPLDPAHNIRAWDRNRRVQFVIVRTRDEGRTTAAAGCRRAAQYIPPTVGPPGTGVARESSTPGNTSTPNTPPRPNAPANPPPASAPPANAPPAAPPAGNPAAGNPPAGAPPRR